MNAFTTHEQTVFYVRVPDTQLEPRVRHPRRRVVAPRVPPDDVESERQVILEEIGMRDDTPDDLVHDLFARAHVPRAPARPRGARQRRRRSRRWPRDDIAEYHAAHYRPSNIVLAAAGNLDARRRRSTGRARGSRDADGARPAAAARPTPRLPQPVAVIDRDTEQAHVVVGVRSLAGARPRPLRADGREPGARRRHVVAAVPGDPRERAASRTPCSRTARLRRRRLSSRSTRAPRPSACRRRSTVIDAELDRLVRRRALRRRARRRPRATSPARSRCRSRRRRAGCAASAGAGAGRRRDPEPRRARRAASRRVTADDVAARHRPRACDSAAHARRRRPARRRVASFVGSPLGRDDRV